MNAGTFNTIPGRNFTKLGSSKRRHTPLGLSSTSQSLILGFLCSQDVALYLEGKTFAMLNCLSHLKVYILVKYDSTFRKLLCLLGGVG